MGTLMMMMIEKIEMIFIKKVKKKKIVKLKNSEKLTFF
jgi:hypothetical protein